MTEGGTDATDVLVLNGSTVVAVPSRITLITPNAGAPSCACSNVPAPPHRAS
jgi:hypothetical protein